MARKKHKLWRRREDRISDLPDHIIQHILSFLPSTKQAIQTSILSKRWRNQWTRLSSLTFDDSIGMSSDKFLNFVNNTLICHDECSNIQKFHLQYPRWHEQDPHFDDKILFATRKHVEELYLCSDLRDLLPNFIFNTCSLIKLTASGCTFMPNETVNWRCLTSLHLSFCYLTDHGLQHILSGTPLLKSLVLHNYLEFDNLFIASKSLKRLVLQKNLGLGATITFMKISCPNLEELSILGLNDNILNIQVSCPQLQELRLIGDFSFKTVEFVNLPSSLCATFDFCHEEDDEGSTNEVFKCLVQDILHQLHCVKELTIGRFFMKCLSALEVVGLSPFVLNLKNLTLNYPSLINHASGISCILRNAPLLEKLVINMPQYHGNLKDFNDSGENFWNSNASIFSCLLPQLKTIHIIGFPKRYDERKLVVHFIQFLLNNAIVLEKMVIILKGQREILPLRVSYPLLHLPRCSKRAIIELLYSK